MTIEKLDTTTPDLTQQNIERLLELFPECRTEGSRDDAPMVDFDLLRQALSDYLVEGPTERYRLDWPGKRQALLTANTPIDKTLRPMREESVDFDTTRNLFIEGDNLDALKLLQETYLGKVKMIYIDPPYNTGGEFLYNDNFVEREEEHRKTAGADAEIEGRLIANLPSGGRFHSKWTSMMYARLKVARNLLRDDGVLFATIDDHEVDTLLKVLKEIFGEHCHAGTVIWRKKASPDARSTIGSVHDYLLVFVKDVQRVKDAIGKMAISEKRKKSFSNPDNDARGPWASVDMTGMTGRATKDQFFEIELPSGRKVSPPEGRSWGLVERTFIELRKDNRIWFGAGGDNVPRVKRFLSEVEGQTVPTYWDFREVGSNEDASSELLELFEAPKLFDTPKPLALIRRMLEIGTNPNSSDIVIDFFAGSSSTGHAVFEQNVMDGGSRKIVLVQSPEPTPIESDARKVGYETISQLSRDRIRRAGKKILHGNPSKAVHLDLGFRAFRIDNGNFQDTTITPKDATQASLAGMVDHIKDDRTDEDLLFGALLRWGVDITLPVEQRELAGRKVWFVDPPEDGSGKGAALIACFERPKSGKGGIDTSLADAMSELAPLRVLFRDDGFADDAAKENVHSRFQQRAPDTQVRVL
jgi:adenine-specific DNA-methyltransferase